MQPALARLSETLGVKLEPAIIICSSTPTSARERDGQGQWQPAPALLTEMSAATLELNLTCEEFGL